MAETLDNDGSVFEHSDFPHEWKCPLCRYETRTMTKFGMKALQEQHMAGHHRPEPRESISMQSTVAPAPKRRNYDVLYLNRFDVTFLTTRGIKIDKDMVVDWDDYGYSSESQKRKM